MGIWLPKIKDSNFYSSKFYLSFKVLFIRIDGNAGFTAQSLDFLKKKVEEGKKLLVSLVMDEMSIHQHIQFDGNQFVGGTGTY